MHDRVTICGGVLGGHHRLVADAILALSVANCRSTWRWRDGSQAPELGPIAKPRGTNLKWPIGKVPLWWSMGRSLDPTDRPKDRRERHAPQHRSPTSRPGRLSASSPYCLIRPKPSWLDTRIEGPLSTNAQQGMTARILSSVRFERIMRRCGPILRAHEAPLSKPAVMLMQSWWSSVMI